MTFFWSLCSSKKSLENLTRIAIASIRWITGLWPLTMLYVLLACDMAMMKHFLINLHCAQMYVDSIMHLGIWKTSLKIVQSEVVHTNLGTPIKDTKVFSFWSSIPAVLKTNNFSATICALKGFFRSVLNLYLEGIVKNQLNDWFLFHI